MGLIFLLLFTSQWFKIYSKNLCGDRKDKVGTSLENTLVDIASIGWIERMLHIGSNFWLMCEYLKVFSTKTGLPLELQNMVAPVAALRCLVLIIELRLACARIIALDVDDRKKILQEEENKGTKDTSSKAAPKAKGKAKAK